MQNNRKPIVGITQGDGNGIGYEVIIKSLADSRILESFTPVIYGSSKLFGFYRKLIHNIEDECAVRDIKSGDIDVLVTAPINKRAMSQEGFGYTGHTEYLEKEFGVKDVAMIMVSSTLKVAVVTGHIKLKDVASSITAEKIVGKLRLMKESLQRDFGIDNPRIAVLGLNPHCGDGGLLGDEEQQIILPAVKQANEEGIAAFGPYSPDGYFLFRTGQLPPLRRDPGDVPRSGTGSVQGPGLRAGRELHRRPSDCPDFTRPRNGLRHGRTGRSRPALHDVVHLYGHRHLQEPASLRRASGRENEQRKITYDKGQGHFQGFGP